MAGNTPAALSKFRERTFAMEEIWKDAVGYEGLYQVSNLGVIRNAKTGKHLKPNYTRTGYATVWLYGKDHLNGRNGKSYQVHRIVANAFCERPDGADEVNHLNENKADNRACNLEWCTHRENSSYGTRGKRIAEANLNGKKSKAVYQFSPDGKLIAVFPSMAEVQRTTGFRKGNIWKQMTGKYETAYGFKWSHNV